MSKVIKKYISRLDEIISRGENILRLMKKDYLDSLDSPDYYESDDFYRDQYIGIYQDMYQRIPKNDYLMLWGTTEEEFINKPELTQLEQDYLQWKINCRTLLSVLIPEGSIHQEIYRKIDDLKWYEGNGRYNNIGDFIIELKALREDAYEGFLGNFLLNLEMEIAADYMSQAEQLLVNGKSGQFDHVPAAVLAGAVLENTIRNMCMHQDPPLPLKEGNKYLLMNRLIDDLKKKGAYNELTAKQLRAWADIRNKAAHGEFSEFNRNDVQTMINGINSFLSDHFS